MDRNFSRSGVKRLLKAVTAFGDHQVSLADRRRAILEEVGAIVGAEAGMWSWGRGWPEPGVVTPVAHLDFGFDDEKRGLFMTWSLDPEFMDTFQRRVLAKMKGECQITSTRQLYAAEEWKSVPPIRELLSLCGWGSFVHSVRYCLGDTWSTLMLIRGIERPDFAPEEIELVDLALECIPWLHATGGEFLPTEAFHGLTSRRRTVLLLLLDGASRKRIASMLGITEDTVGDHIKAIYNHFDVGSSTELAAMFLKSR